LMNAIIGYDPTIGVVVNHRYGLFWIRVWIYNRLTRHQYLFCIREGHDGLPRRLVIQPIAEVIKRA
jgi:hypothetical protein